MTYNYSLSGALIEQKYPSGRVFKNVLDADGDLAIVQSSKNAASGYFNYAKNFTYTAAGAVSSMQLGNGRWESTVFNSRLQPTQIALGTVQSGTDKLKLDFNYARPTITAMCFHKRSLCRLSAQPPDSRRRKTTPMIR